MARARGAPSGVCASHWAVLAGRRWPHMIQSSTGSNWTRYRTRMAGALRSVKLFGTDGSLVCEPPHGECGNWCCVGDATTVSAAASATTAAAVNAPTRAPS